MDTRTKIIGLEHAAVLSQREPVRWVTGHFDPLLAEHGRHLRELAQPGQALIAVVTNPPSPLLPQRARAELVAALASVDYVVMKDGPPVDDPDEARITSEFVSHVLRRHRQAQ